MNDELDDAYAYDVFRAGAISYGQANRIAANLRPKVTTPEELDTYPEGTIFQSAGRLGRLWAHSASALDGGTVWADKHDALPLTIIYQERP